MPHDGDPEKHPLIRDRVRHGRFSDIDQRFEQIQIGRDKDVAKIIGLGRPSLSRQHRLYEGYEFLTI